MATTYATILDPVVNNAPIESVDGGLIHYLLYGPFRSDPLP